MKVEPEVFGSAIDMGTRSCEPKIAQEAFGSCAQVLFGDPRQLVQQGRLGTVIEAAHQLKRRNAEVPVVASISGPISTAASVVAPLAFMKELRTDAMIDLRALKADFPGITTMGNLSTSLLEFGDSDKVARNTARLLRDGIDIISPACGLSTSTSLENIRALTGTVQHAGNR